MASEPKHDHPKPDQHEFYYDIVWGEVFLERLYTLFSPLALEAKHICGGGEGGASTLRALHCTGQGGKCTEALRRRVDTTVSLAGAITRNPVPQHRERTLSVRIFFPNCFCSRQAVSRQRLPQMRGRFQVGEKGEDPGLPEEDPHRFSAVPEGLQAGGVEVSV